MYPVIADCTEVAGENANLVVERLSRQPLAVRRLGDRRHRVHGRVRDVLKVKSVMVKWELTSTASGSWLNLSTRFRVSEKSKNTAAAWSTMEKIILVLQGDKKWPNKKSKMGPTLMGLDIKIDPNFALILRSPIDKLLFLVLPCRIKLIQKIATSSLLAWFAFLPSYGLEEKTQLEIVGIKHWLSLNASGRSIRYTKATKHLDWAELLGFILLFPILSLLCLKLPC